MTNDIVTRLRAYDCDGWEAADVIEADQAEIERLRAAGDALVAAIRNHDLAEAHLKAWDEARRG